MRWLGLVAVTVSLAASAACGGGGAAGGSGAGAQRPIEAPEGVWTWVPVDGTACGDGSRAGIGVNLAASKDLLVYFEGGGACWDALTCFTLRSAAHVDAPYDAASFAGEVAALEGSEVLSRTAPGNAFAAASFVYVPYCTGDVHAGTRVASYDGRTVHHVGALNVQRFIEALQATRPDASRVWLLGSSAGGYGATMNLPRFTAAWPKAEVHLLEDSSPFVEVMAYYQAWQASWGLAFPDGCHACDAHFPGVIDALTATYPASRIGLLSYDEDATIKAYFGYSGSLRPALDALLDEQFARPTTRAFVLGGASHVLLGDYATLASPSGVALRDWVQAWALGDPAWVTVR